MTNASTDIERVKSRVNTLLGRIGSKRRARIGLEKQMNDELQSVRKRYGRSIDPISKDELASIAELTELVMTHFDQLVVPGTKTVTARDGKIELREASKPGLVIADGVKEETIIKRIRRARGYRKFLRIKLELKRAELVAAPKFVDKIKDLSIRRKKTLYIRPANVQGAKIKENDPLNVDVSSKS